MIRFLHTSDWQLGMTRHFFSEGVQERFAQSRFDAIRELGRIACAVEGSRRFPGSRHTKTRSAIKSLCKILEESGKDEEAGTYKKLLNND